MADFNPVFSLAGFVVGVLVGMTGVGGGSLMTPMLLAFGFPAIKAVGTDLLFASITKSVGTTVHAPRGTVDWRIVSRLAIGSIPATALTTLALRSFGRPDADLAKVITVTLGIALITTGLAMFFRARILAYAARHRRAPSKLRTTVLTVLLGLFLGVVVTITSVGAGAIGVTILLILYPDLPTRRIAGSDIAHAVPLTMIAGLFHWHNGDVNFDLLANLLVGSVPGIIIGSLLAVKTSDRNLQPVFALVLVVVGTLTLFPIH